MPTNRRFTVIATVRKSKGPGDIPYRWQVGDFSNYADAYLVKDHLATLYGEDFKGYVTSVGYTGGCHLCVSPDGCACSLNDAVAHTRDAVNRLYRGL